MPWTRRASSYRPPGLISTRYTGGRPRCVFTNVQQRTILDLLRDRNRSTVVTFLLGVADKERVELVAWLAAAPSDQVLQKRYIDSILLWVID
jgi:transposase